MQHQQRHAWLVGGAAEHQERGLRPRAMHDLDGRLGVIGERRLRGIGRRHQPEQQVHVLRPFQPRPGLEHPAHGEGGQLEVSPLHQLGDGARPDREIEPGEFGRLALLLGLGERPLRQLEVHLAHSAETTILAAWLRPSRPDSSPIGQEVSMSSGETRTPTRR